eukprot:TRINITY_DN11671_c0_g1_i2.p1 TRINITY_DN11671_c0_g1~~TRINITY_DN11671_c0_g1_i2.p1  ORF type:complete len:157 (-),score=9.26 TRINITY_DN11671_c0_g1_i2:423-893(-)
MPLDTCVSGAYATNSLPIPSQPPSTTYSASVNKYQQKHHAMRQHFAGGVIHSASTTTLPCRVSTSPHTASSATPLALTEPKNASLFERTQINPCTPDRVGKPHPKPPSHHFNFKHGTHQCAEHTLCQPKPPLALSAHASRLKIKMTLSYVQAQTVM